MDKTLYRGLKFTRERFSDIGVGTSPQVNRLLFKNQDFKQFVDYNFLTDNNYIIKDDEKSFNDFVSLKICDESQDIDNNLSEFISKVLDTILESAKTKQSGGAEIDSSFYRFNDEINVPMTNPYFFNFLHMFKYILTKSYSKFRFWRTYRIIDGLVDIMNNKYYKEDGNNENIIDNQLYYKNTYLYALRRKITNGINKTFGVLKQKGDDDLQVKNCIELIKFEKNIITISNNNLETSDIISSKLKNNVDEKNDESNDESNINTDKNTPEESNIKGGYTRKSNNTFNKTKKIKGGYWLYSSRLYRILNMHLDTSNIYNYSQIKEQNQSRTASISSSILNTYNSFTKNATINKIPAYIVKEQIRFLLLAYHYLKNRNSFNDIIKNNTYEKITEFISETNFENVNDFENVNNFKKYIGQIDNLDYTIVEQTYHLFIIDSSAIHNDLFKLLETIHKMINYSTPDITYIKKIFTNASNCMFYKYAENLFEDPKNISTKLSDKLEKYYKDKLENYYKRKGFVASDPDNYKIDGIDFTEKFTFCLIRTPHFTCSQIGGVALGSILNAKAKMLEVISNCLLSSLGNTGGITRSIVKTTVLGTNLMAEGIASLVVNTPNCYYSLALMFYVLILSIKPFMPQEKREFIPKSDRLNTTIYKPVTNIKKLSLTSNSVISNMSNSLQNMSKYFGFTRKTSGGKHKKHKKFIKIIQ
jgi:hypothetical protein